MYHTTPPEVYIRGVFDSRRRLELLDAVAGLSGHLSRWDGVRQCVWQIVARQAMLTSGDVEAVRSPP